MLLFKSKQEIFNNGQNEQDAMQNQHFKTSHQQLITPHNINNSKNTSNDNGHKNCNQSKQTTQMNRSVKNHWIFQRCIKLFPAKQFRIKQSKAFKIK